MVERLMTEAEIEAARAQREATMGLSDDEYAALIERIMNACAGEAGQMVRTEVLEIALATLMGQIMGSYLPDHRIHSHAKWLMRLVEKSARLSSKMRGKLWPNDGESTVSVDANSSVQ